MNDITENDFWNTLNEPEPVIEFLIKYKIYRWYNEENKLHRENDRPAEIWYNSDSFVYIREWYQNGELHRENGLPAVIWYYPDGSIYKKAWYQNYQRHRIYGPAEILYSNNGGIYKARWYFNGTPYTEKKYYQKLKELGYE